MTFGQVMDLVPFPAGRSREGALFFCAIFVIYLASPIVSSSDSHFVLPTALSMVRHGDANIDEYHDKFPETPWATRKEGEHFYNVYPPGVPLLVLPLVWAADKVAALFGTDLESVAIRENLLFLELVFASLITAAAAGLLFFHVRGRLSFPKSLLLAGLFALGTSAYSTASRGLWQHGPSMLLLVAAIIVYERLPKWGTGGSVILGVMVGYSYAVRPSNLAAIAGLALLLAITARHRLIPYCFGAALGVGPLFAFNLIVFGTWSSHYYRLTQTGLLTLVPALKPFYAILISPSRGLFVFSPFLLFALLRFRPSYWSRHRVSPLEILLAILCFAGCIGVARSPLGWWGGGSYGPRLLCDIVPFLIVLLVPIVDNLSLTGRRGTKLLTVLFLVAGALSVAIHARGALSTSGSEWNATPISIDQAPERAWSWRDPQFLRGIFPTDKALIPTTTALSFYAIRPCRVFDTRLAAGAFGGPALSAGKERQIPIPESLCGVPRGAAAYSLNLTVIPRGPLAWLNAWETGEPMPITSVMNASTGLVTANAAIIRAGRNGSISILSASDADFVVDISGYFAPTASIPNP